jgi:putative oxidoreductase
MKRLLSNTVLILLVRIFLGALFIVASLDKITDVNAFAASILNYKIVDASLATLAATILPWLELFCGLGLIVGIFPKTSAFLITAMLVAFTALVASALIRGLDISCGCFTQDPHAGRIGLQKILENCGMIVLGLYSMFAEDRSISLLHIFGKRSNAQNQ